MTNADRLSKAIQALGEFDHEEFADLKAEYAIKFVDEYAEFLIQQAERVEDLEKKNKVLNQEIGEYSGRVYEIKQAIGANVAELGILATRMLKGESE